MTDATKHIAVLDHILNGTGELPKMEDSERAIKAAIAALAMQVIDDYLKKKEKINERKI